jgi:hypothetical protein
MFALTVMSTNCVLAQETNILRNRVMYTKWNFADFFHDSTKWVWELDVVYRRQSELGQPNFWYAPLRMSVRPWIAYQVTKFTRVSFQPIAGFYSAPRYSREADLESDFERELRTTLQIVQNSYYYRFNFTHRFRFESRWRGIDNEDGVNHNFRIRYRIRARIPLNTNYFYTNNTWYISAYSEIHAEFGRDFGVNYLSQNRNFVGIGYRFWDWTRVELGYLHQYNVRGNVYNVDISQGPMFYLFIDLMSKVKRSK